MNEAKRSGVTAPSGFLAGGFECGIKGGGKKDLAIIASDRPANACGLFTTNLVTGAPVQLSRKHLRHSKTRGVVINSGNSNTFTSQGYAHAETMAKTLSRFLGCQPEHTLVASTGVIGQALPIDKVTKGIRNFAPMISSTGGGDAAEAILTTDLVTKECETSVEIGDKAVVVGGCAKGSGMINPSMATMLAFITTDANVTKKVLHKMMKYACDQSFHRISVDGETSTSDMVIIIANGAAESDVVNKTTGKNYTLLRDAVTKVCVDLAKKIVRDGEGATKFITVEIKGARSEKEARLAAKSIASSNLVKTALFGNDANWGRILAAAGNSGARFDPDKVALAISGVPILKKGKLISAGWEEKVAPLMMEKEINICLDLCAGKGAWGMWTCDLSYDYVKINAEYRS